MDGTTRNAEGWDCQIIGPERLNLPDGIYEAAYLGHDTAFLFKTAKVFLRFRIVTTGPFHAVELYRAYRARALVGRPGKGGRFKLARGSDLYYDLGRLLHLRARPDRISLQGLLGCIWRIRVRTVTTDYKQRALPEWDRYSVVEEILGLEAGAPQREQLPVT